MRVVDKNITKEMKTVKKIAALLVCTLALLCVFAPVTSAQTGPAEKHLYETEDLDEDAIQAILAQLGYPEEIVKSFIQRR